MKEKQFILFNININHTACKCKIETPEVEELQPTNRAYSVRTDFSEPHTLLRHKKNEMISLNQASQVHEYVIHHFLSYHKGIKGLNFVVKDPVRILIEVQIQLGGWDSMFNRHYWDRVCRDLSKKVSMMMPVGLCNIKPI